MDNTIFQGDCQGKTALFRWLYTTVPKIVLETLERVTKAGGPQFAFIGHIKRHLISNQVSLNAIIGRALYSTTTLLEVPTVFSVDRVEPLFNRVPSLLYNSIR